jgi:hypothetical protein
MNEQNPQANQTSLPERVRQDSVPREYLEYTRYTTALEGKCKQIESKLEDKCNHLEYIIDNVCAKKEEIHKITGKINWGMLAFFATALVLVYGLFSDKLDTKWEKIIEMEKRLVGIEQKIK